MHKISSSQIFAFSELGTYDEFDTNEQAINSGRYSAVKYLTGYEKPDESRMIHKYVFIDTQTQNELLKNSWLLRLNRLYYDNNPTHTINYSIIDPKGIIQHFTSKKSNLTGIGDLIVHFSTISKYIDWKDFETIKQQEIHQEEKANLQKQIDEIRSELTLLKEIIGK